jgi:hypothetical protein
MENEAPKQETEPKHYGWHEVFYAVLTQPKLETFQELLKDPQAKAQRAYLWMLLPTILSGISSQAITSGITGFDWLEIVLFGVVLGGIFGLIYFIAIGWIIQRVAIFFGGDKMGYGKFHYARGMYMPVLVIAYSLVLILLGQNPNIAQFAFSFILMIELILTGIALRAVNQLPWGQIILVVTTWYLLTAIVGLGLGLR